MDERKPQWCNWCRLCAKEDPENNVNIQLADQSLTAGVDVKCSLKKALEKYFCIETSNDAQMPIILCGDCNLFLSLIMKFSERVQRVQQMYVHLMQDDSCDIKSIRFKFDVLDDNRLHGCTQLAMTEVNPISFQETQASFTRFTIKQESAATNQTEFDEEPLEYDAPEDGDDPFETTTDFSAYNPSSSFSEAEIKQTRRSKRTRKRKSQKDSQIDGEKNIDTRTGCDESIKKDSVSEEEPKPKEYIRRKRKKQSDINRKKKDEIRIDYTMDAACAVCSEKFYIFSTYCEHMLTTHVNNQWKCITCNRALQSRYDFERHLRKHLPKTSIIKHICTICGLELSCSTTLKRHLSVHSDKMQHLCDHCGRAFKRDTTLKAHMILHTGLKPYSCNFCQITFACSSNCRRHMRKAHSEEFAALQTFGNKTQTKNT